MIVFDLKCYDRGHVFEGWFGSSADYEKQRASGMIACPVCGDTQVRKAVMSPAVSAKSNQRDTGASIPTSERQVPASAPVVEGRGIALSNSSAAEMVRMRALISALAETQAKILEKSEWRSEEHTSELQSLMRNSYAVFCLKKKKEQVHRTTQTQ